MPCNAEQQHILDAIAQTQAPLIFIQGKAGTGKSFLVDQLSRQLGCPVLVPTYMAKSVYSLPAASVIHEFFGVNFSADRPGELDSLEAGYQNPDGYTAVRNSSFLMRSRLAQLKYLIVDEISMVRADLFEMMNKICQVARQDDRPFGAIQVIAVGDLFQLPPIVPQPAVWDYLQDTYGGIYFFNSPVVQKNLAHMAFYELKTSVRHQHDREYEKLLDALREPGGMQQAIQVLQRLNSRVVPAEKIPSDAVTIATTNEEVNRINARKLAALPGPLESQQARFTVRRRNTESADPKKLTKENSLSFSGDQVPQAYTLQEYYPLEVPSKFAPVLEYKINSLVMFTKNYKKDGICNGDVGLIKETKYVLNKKNFPETHFVVEKTGSGRPGQQAVTVEVAPDFHYRFQIEYDKAHKKLVSGALLQRTVQYPLKTAYAFTIHKSQGQTYKNIVIDLDSHIFAPGQLYVALSRATCLDALYLTKPIAVSDCFMDPNVLGFLKQLRSKEPLPSLSAGAVAAQPLTEPCRQFMEQVRQSTAPDNVKENISAWLQYYNDTYQAGEYGCAFSELLKIFAVLSVAFKDDTLSAQREKVRQLPQQALDRAACDGTLQQLSSLFRHAVQMPLRAMSADQHILDPRPALPKVKRLAFENGQTGITYEGLFGAYLADAARITLKEGYIMKWWQIENLQEFMRMLAKIKKPDAPVHLHLVTRAYFDPVRPEQNEANFDEQKRKLHALQTQHREQGILFSFEFVPAKELHDREIITDTGWIISLGRGLDIWNKCPRHSLQDLSAQQAARSCHGGFAISFLFDAAAAVAQIAA